MTKIDPLKLEVGFVTDKLIADVLDIEYDKEYASGATYTHSWIATTEKLYQQHYNAGVTRDGKPCWSFSPSRIVADAFWAAGEAKLFTEKGMALYNVTLTPYLQVVPSSPWVIGHLEYAGKYLYYVESWTGIAAHSPEMAICKAILCPWKSVKHKDVPSQE